MKEFPIKNEKYCKWFRKTDWSAKFVDVNTLPKKMYMVLDGKLKAVKPVATAIAHYYDGTPNYNHVPRLYLVADVAGYEKRQMIRLTCEWTKFYHSVEDFHSSKFFTVRGRDVERVLNESGIQTNSWSGYMYPIYYRWDKNACKVDSSMGSSIGLPVALWSDEFGVHVDWSASEDVCMPTERYSMKTKMYRTAEDCKKDNAVQVVEFEDENEGLGIMDTSNSHDAQLVNKINEAWSTNRVWREFTLIVAALMHRDHSQILEGLGKEIAEYDNDAKMVEELAPEYLQHIADDQDLQQIIDFIGI